MLCQREASDIEPFTAHLLRKGGFVCRLSPAVLRYDGLAADVSSSSPPAAYVHAVDAALCPAHLRKLQAALAPDSPFWSEHGYSCGESPFFSYVHALDVPPRTGFDRVLGALLHVARQHFPRAKSARYAEWWAHCRPHGIGHQLHFDSDDEGEVR